MQNPQDLRNGASRLVFLTAEVQKAATRAQVAGETLTAWFNDCPHKEVLFDANEISAIHYAKTLLAHAEERMNAVMQDIQEKCQAL